MNSTRNDNFWFCNQKRWWIGASLWKNSLNALLFLFRTVYSFSNCYYFHFSALLAVAKYLLMKIYFGMIGKLDF